MKTTCLEYPMDIRLCRLWLRSARSIPVAIFLVASVSTAAAAQGVAAPAGGDSPSSVVAPQGAHLNATSYSAGLVEGVFIAAFRWNRVITPNVGYQIAFKTPPQVLARGALASTLEVGPTVAIPLGRGALLLNAALAPAFVLHVQGGGGVLLLSTGAGVIVPLGENFGLRLDWTKYFSTEADGTLSLFEFGFAKVTR